MKIEEAIRILQRDIDEHYCLEGKSVDEAHKLGIEALMREQHRRKYDIHLPIELLPGETEP